MRKKQVITNGDDVISALMKKAQELNDPELLAMANSLSNKPKPTKKKAAKKKPTKKKLVKPIVEEEVEEVENIPVRKRTENKPDNEKRAVKFGKYQPPKGPNRFQDDGVTGRDAEDERLKKLGFNRGRIRPKFALVKSTCSNCGAKEQTHPMFNTEFFKCEKCSRKQA